MTNGPVLAQARGFPMSKESLKNRGTFGHYQVFLVVATKTSKLIIFLSSYCRQLQQPINVFLSCRNLLFLLQRKKTQILNHHHQFLFFKTAFFGGQDNFLVR